MAALSQARAADREAMAARIGEVAAKFGATVERCKVLVDREINLRIRLDGAEVNICFSGDAEGPRGWGFLGHWVCAPGRKFRAGFQSVASFYPHHKATTTAAKFDVFAALIQNGLRQVAAGRAFADPETARGAP